jgi:hypothetical protein
MGRRECPHCSKSNLRSDHYIKQQMKHSGSHVVALRSRPRSYARLKSVGVGLAALMAIGLFVYTQFGTSRDCVGVGEDLFENLRRVSAHAASLDVSVEPMQAAAIVGAAKAVQDLGGRGVQVCLRASADNHPEFRITAIGESYMDRWVDVAEWMKQRH